MKIEVKNLENKVVREIDLLDAVFSYPYKEHLIHQTVVAYLASQRRGTHKIKGRSEVSGGGRKPWRQKGTGRSRAGSIRSPLWRGGGTAHGPTPRSYTQKLSSREKRNALKSALSRKLADSGLIVVDQLDLNSHKTKSLTTSLRGLGVDGKALLIDSWDNDNLKLASRNHQDFKAVDALAVTVYDVVDRAFVVISEGALQRLTEVLGK